MPKSKDFIKFVEQYGKEVFMEDPPIGSGIIKRRVIVINKRKFLKAKYFSEKSKERNKDPNDKRTKGLKAYWAKRKEDPYGRITYPSVSHKQIYKYWCGKGYPFVKHKTFPSKTNDRIMSLISRYLKKFEARQIMEAIDICHRLFTAPWFKYKPRGKWKMALSTFLQMEPNNYEVQVKRRPDLPQSWLEECMKGERHLHQKYSSADGKLVENVDRKELEYANKYIMDTIKQKYSKREYDMSDPRVRTSIFRITRYLYNFARLNDLTLSYLIKFINSAMLNYKTIRIRGLSGMQREYFYFETLPSALAEYDGATFGDYKWNTKWDEIKKQLPKKLDNKTLIGAP